MRLKKKAVNHTYAPSANNASKHDIYIFIQDLCFHCESIMVGTNVKRGVEIKNLYVKYRYKELIYVSNKWVQVARQAYFSRWPVYARGELSTWVSKLLLLRRKGWASVLNTYLSKDITSGELNNR